MLIKRISPRTKQENEMDLPITQEQLNAYGRGVLLQNAFPNLTPDQREFFQTGLTAEDWAAIFPPEEDEDMDPHDGRANPAQPDALDGDDFPAGRAKEEK
jgi:hypothetical protein